jgi:HNH endonuclease
VRLVENDNGELLDVGRKTRSIPPALRRALSARDSGCRFPGCTFHRYVDAHHIEHWADGGETKLSNLVTLCRAHHRMVHKGEIIIKTNEAAGWQFLSAERRAYQGAYRENRPSYEWNALHKVHDAQGVYIDARTAATRWAGERMDYDLAIFGLFSSLARANRISAETSAA